MTLFTTHATRLIERGYSVIPIIPGDKRPGEWRGNEWHGMSQWQRYCDRAPTGFEMSLWEKWPEPSICVALGRASNLTAIDFDYGSPEIRAALEALLPPSPVRKMGAKGYTAFYRGFALASKKSLVDGVSVIEVLGHGRQTVLPPSIHPEGMAYTWLTPDTLETLTVNELPELPKDFHDQVAKTLAQFQGTVSDDTRQTKVNGTHLNGDHNTYWRDINDAALQNLSKWVPILLPDAKPGAGGGYRAVPHWRNVTKQTLKVGIHPTGIKDHATDQGMTPIDLTMTVLGADLGTAVNWLKKQLGMQSDPIFIPDLESLRPILIAGTTDKLAEEIEEEYQAQDSISPEETAIIPAKGALGMLVDHMNLTAIRPQPVLALAAALCALGTLAGRRYRSPSDLRTNIYTVSIADSGAGKNHARLVVDTLFHDHLDCGNRIGGNKIASGSGLLTAVHRCPAILFQQDEFGMFLGAVADQRGPKHQTEILNNMTELFTAASTTFHGTEYADQRDRPKKQIVQPCLSFNGTTTPQEFWGALGSSNALNGSLARFLILQSDNSYPDPQPTASKEFSPELIDLLRRICGYGGMGLNAEFAPELITATYDETASVLISKLETETTKKLRQLEGTDYTAFWARRVEHTIKLAMIHAIGCNPENPIITTADVRFGQAIVDQSIAKMTQGVERYVADNVAEKYTKRVMEIIRKSKQISKTDLYKRTHWLGRDRDNVLKSLIESGSIAMEVIETNTRPKAIYKICE